MYPTFFGLILALVGYKAFLEDYTVRILLAWPLLSLAIMFSAYSFRKPFFVCGKKSDGSSNWALVIGNLPWLMFTWLIWFFEVSISSEDPINHIPDTNLYIGRYPRVFFPKRKFDLVIDLTAEFPVVS